MIWLALAGWLVALVFAALWWMGRTTTVVAPTPTPPVRIVERTHTQVLQNMDGVEHSVRTVRGAPPNCVYRPHGKGSATRYRYLGQDGERYLYRAEN